MFIYWQSAKSIDPTTPGINSKILYFLLPLLDPLLLNDILDKIFFFSHNFDYYFIE